MALLLPRLHPALTKEGIATALPIVFITAADVPYRQSGLEATALEVPELGRGAAPGLSAAGAKTPIIGGGSRPWIPNHCIARYIDWWVLMYAS